MTPSSRGLALFAKATAGLTLLLVVAGASVTSTGSALAVPDWPLSYGTLFPRMRGGVLFEHGHRMIAGLVAVCIFVLAGWLHLREPRRWVRRLGIAAALLVVTQAVLGGVTVLLRLPAAISVAHAGLAEAVFALTVAIALVTSRAWAGATTRGAGAGGTDAVVSRAALGAALLVYAQILAGAVIRHTGAGLVFPDFPLSGGRVVPAFASAGAVFQYAHRIGALLVAAAVVALVVAVHRRAARDAGLLGLSRLLGLLVATQIALGASAIWSRLLPPVTVLHVAVGALLFVSLVATTLWAYRHRLDAAPERAGAPVRAVDLLDLTKPVLSALVVATTAAGLVIAPGGPPALGLALATILGTAAVVGGANALNCWLERDVERLMERTRKRPLPAGRLRPRAALVFGIVLSAAGLAVLLFVRPIAALLAAVALTTYVAVYTPLKRRTALCTLVGAIPGAIPPAIGWAATTGRVDPGAWALVAVLFLWQPAHFLAIAWLYREDYARAGMPMLTVLYPEGVFVGRQILWYAAALVPISLLLAPLSRAGTPTLVGAALLGVTLVAVALPGAFGPQTPKRARRTFLASIGYMFLLLALLVADCVIRGPRAT